jgi:hypothetical protein
MAVVQRGGVVPAGTYTRVGAVAAPPLEVAKVLEQALQLVLGHARPHPPHHLRQGRGLKERFHLVKGALRASICLQKSMSV